MSKSVYCFAPFDGWTNHQLVKNCGALPLIFHKNYGFRAVMVGGKCGEYPNLDLYLKGVEMEFFPSVEVEAKIQYIKENAKKIDLVVLHGYSYEYAPMMIEYKKLRPDGKIYMETDANFNSQDRLTWNDEEYKALFNLCDVVGVSCRVLHKFLNQKWNCVVDYLPNGFYNFLNVDMTVDFAQKENIILTVGRIGAYPKNNEMLLEAFSMVYKQIPDWKLQLVGNVTTEFSELLQNVYRKCPGIEKQIIMTGLVADKVRLMEIYKNAKIFVISSLSEGGTPNVIAEALSSGCYILCSSIDGAPDATDDCRCGDIFDMNNVRELSDLLISRCSDQDRLLQGERHALQYAQKKFNYENIMARLYYLLYHEVG